jgi:MFS family permease
MTAPITSESNAGLRAFRALRYPRYRWYWYSGLGMTAAQGIQQLAMAWLVLDLTDSVGQLGLVIFMQGVPMALASFYGGMLADRYDRRTILLLAQTLTMLNLAVLAFLTTANLIELWQVYLSAIGLGLMQAVTLPARNALIRSLVGDEDMLNAVALNAVQFHASRVIWPSFAGTLISLTSVGVTLAISAGFSLTGIIFLAMIGTLKDEGVGVRETASQLRQMVDGLRFSFSEPNIKTVMLLSLTAGLFGLSFVNLAPAFARNDLDLGASGAGFFLMASGVGAIIGSVSLLFFPVRDSKKLFVLLMVPYGLSLLAQAANPWLPGAFIIMGIFGLSTSALVVSGQTFIQMNVPENLLGRVVGLWSLAGSLGFITSLPIGLAGDELGLRWSVGASAVLLLVSTLWFGFIAPRESQLRKQVTPAAP